ncbi:cytidylyltransferase domain-containing protein [Neptuniibacter sp. QD48_55]|uniref:acylneuraminate cytidylyltransferase family protein n=1 Tax=Neptuniibacter sp. QD48_55 TaxID=3398212 RepID=UPI0039F4AD8E
MITAIIPARGGSKRLPGKNIKLLNGRPLIFHSLDAVLGHGEISKVVFTSDDDEYLHLVEKEYGNSVVLEKRPDTYASDTRKVHDEIVRLKESKVIESEWFMLCLPTAPLRSFETVKRMLVDWKQDKEARFSASEYDFPIQFAFEIDSDNNWSPISDESPMITGNTRSQDIPVRYRPNGAMYLQKTETLGRTKTFYLEAKPFLMDSSESVDVDTELDFKIAEIVMKEQQV